MLLPTQYTLDAIVLAMVLGATLYLTYNTLAVTAEEDAPFRLREITSDEQIVLVCGWMESQCLFTCTAGLRKLLMVWVCAIVYVTAYALCVSNGSSLWFNEVEDDDQFLITDFFRASTKASCRVHATELGRQSLETVKRDVKEWSFVSSAPDRAEKNA